LKLNRIKRIVIHCSASSWGDRTIIDQWHRERGWRCIGYHYVILNGHRERNSVYTPGNDGRLEIGRQLNNDPWIEANEVGAHVKGYNLDSVGICLIGQDGKHTYNQLHAALKLVRGLLKSFDLIAKDVVGHFELSPAKTCPDIDMEAFRAVI
jgi:hypothetical protein